MTPTARNPIVPDGRSRNSECICALRRRRQESEINLEIAATSRRDLPSLSSTAACGSANARFLKAFRSWRTIAMRTAAKGDDPPIKRLSDAAGELLRGLASSHKIKCR